MIRKIKKHEERNTMNRKVRTSPPVINVMTE
jgi:hypothetical protein